MAGPSPLGCALTMTQRSSLPLGLAFVLAFAAQGLVRLAAEGSLPVVPGAFGFGMATRAAYGCGTDPAILHVTNANDTGAGSFRAAMTASGPRVVLFDVSGYIDISSDIIATSPCLTIAGQTAPSPGITVRTVAGGGNTEAMILINTHDVLLQHFRVRPGWPAGRHICNSGILAYGYPAGAHYNVVLDHMSVSWAQDEQFYSGPTAANGGDANFTIWRSIAAEGLWNADTDNVCTGALGGEAANGHNVFIEGHRADILQSVMAHSRERNPMIDGSIAVRVLNNIIYGWQGEWGVFLFNKEANPGPWFLNAAGNRFIVGPQSNNPGVGGAVMFWYGEAYPDSSFEDPGNKSYRADNTVSNGFGTTIIETHNLMAYNPDVSAPPSQAPMPTGYTVIASSSLEAFLLPKVGARPLDRDAVDARVIANITARAGGFISNESDVGGYPALAANTRVLTPPASPHADSGNGYRNLEVWLQGLARALEQGGASVAPNPPTSVHVMAALEGTRAIPAGATPINLGDDWQTIVNAAATGQVFYVQAGTHRLQSIAPKTGQTFLGEPGAVMSGGKVLPSGDFVSVSGGWKITGQTQPVAARTGECQIIGNGKWTTSYPGCSFNEELFFDDVRQVRKDTNDVGSGEWYFDDAADTIYVGSDPSGHVVETDVAIAAFKPTADNVTIRGIRVTKYASPAQHGAIDASGVAGWSVIDCVVDRNHGAGLRGSKDLHVATSVVTANGQEGIVAADGSGVIVENTEISYNNGAHFDPGWEAGGTKFVNTSGLIARGNYVHHNEGPGLWADIDNINLLFENNTVAANQQMGILHEISYAAIIRNNTVTGNGLAYWVPDYIWGVGILVAASPNVEVSGNTLSGNRGGIAGVQQARGSGLYGPHVITNLNVHDNDVTIDRAAGIPTWNGLVDDTSSSTIFTTDHNVFEGNTYHLKTDTAYFVWLNVGDRLFAAWQGFGHDTPSGSASTF